MQNATKYKMQKEENIPIQKYTKCKYKMQIYKMQIYKMQINKMQMQICKNY